MNVKELCLTNYGMTDDEVRKELERYSDMFPKFFVHIAAQEFLENDFGKILNDINQDHYKNLNSSELKFLKQIMIDYSIISMFYVHSEEEKNKFHAVVQEFRDIFPFFSYQEQAQFLHYVDEKIENQNKLYEQFKKDEYYDPKNLKARDDYVAYLKDFIHSETDAVALICSDKTKEEKIEGIKSYIQKMQDVDHECYMVNGSKIQLKECEDIIKSVYSDYFGMDGYWKDPVVLNQLLILYNYYRLTGKKEARDLFFGKTLDYIRKELPNSRDNFRKTEIDQYFLGEQIKEYTPTEQAIAISYNNLLANYKVINANIETCHQSDSITPKKVAREEFRQQNLWMEQEERTKGLRLQLEQQKLCGGDNQTINELTEKIQEIEAQVSHAFDVETIYLQMQRVMDIFFVLLKGLELYKESDECSESFNVSQIFWKLKRMDEDLKEILFKEPFLYEEHTDRIKEVKAQILERKEYQAMEEKLSEDIHDKDIELEMAGEEKARLEEDNELLKLVIERKTAEVDCMRSILNDTITALKEESINEIMQKRVSIISDEKLQESDMELIDELSNTISSILQKKAKDSDAEGLKEAREKVVEELGSTRAGRLNEEILQVLSTAEFLYGEYIEGKEPVKGFDYSCISAMYYQALENTYNYLMYSEYIAMINKSKSDLSKLLMHKKEKNSYGYFPEDRITSYVIDYMDGKNYDYIVKNTCEYGNFIHLLQSLWNKNFYKQVTKYRDYICKVFGWTPDSRSVNGLPDTFSKKLKRLIDDMESARVRRNNASHGGFIIDYNTAKEDKTYVLIQEVKGTRIRYKKIILAILDLYKY